VSSPFLGSADNWGRIWQLQGSAIAPTYNPVLSFGLNYKTREQFDMGSIIWTIIIGALAGIVAKFIHPGKNEPSGFVLTAILGIVGAFLASYAGQAMGYYAEGQGAGFIASVIGAVVLLVVWGIFAKRPTA
jgi:uncharacterized membrane protein YeaQ/YmgE (transglycosylase-associated protein family)